MIEGERRSEWERSGEAAPAAARRSDRPQGRASGLAVRGFAAWRWIGRALIAGSRAVARLRPFGRHRLVGVPVAIGVTLGAAGAAYPPSRDAALALYESTRHAILSRPEYRIRWIEVSGAPRVGRDAIVAALRLEPEERAALGFDAAEARRRVETIGWVESAAVYVRPPQTLEIRIVERTPAALWRRDGRLTLLDRSGAVIDEVAGRDAWPELPLFVGAGARGALAEGLALHERAAAAGLPVLALARIGDRRWDLDLLGGPRVFLPERDPAAAIDDVIAWTARADLLQRNFEVVDLRIAFAPTVRVREPAPDDRSAAAAAGAKPSFGPEG